MTNLELPSDKPVGMSSLTGLVESMLQVEVNIRPKIADILRHPVIEPVKLAIIGSSEFKADYFKAL